MGLRSTTRRLSRSIRDRLGRWYSPRELRALGLFLLLGIVVLCYRGSRSLYAAFYPSEASHDKTNSKVADSLFAALSAKAEKEDSLIFSLPEDSIAPRSMRRPAPKGSTLAAGSISINNATKEQLLQLPGVGPSTADKIIEYRQKRGKFRTVGELGNVKTIGKKRFARMKSYLRLN